TAERSPVAAHGDERRRVRDGGERVRIIGFAQGDERGAELGGGGKLALGVRPRADAAWPRRAAAPRQLRQGGKRGAGAAVMVDEGAERARPDMLAADQAQPVELLRVG